MRGGVFRLRSFFSQKYFLFCCDLKMRRIRPERSQRLENRPWKALLSSLVGGDGQECIICIITEASLGVPHSLTRELLDYEYRLNMDISKVYLGSMCTAVHVGWDPRKPPPPPYLGSYTRALLVSQDRWHLFVTPWLRATVNFSLYSSSTICHHSNPNYKNVMGT